MPVQAFARHVLRLEEDAEEHDGLSPAIAASSSTRCSSASTSGGERERGRSITPATIGAAHEMLASVIEELLARLPASDAAIERTRLLGSPVAPGLADLVFTMEATRQVGVSGRRLEDRFDGLFELAGPDGPRDVPLRGVVDRIDFLDDGTLRVIDYKASMPSRPVQLAIYATTAAGRLGRVRGRDWRVAEAAYVVYGAQRAVKPLARETIGPAGRARGRPRYGWSRPWNRSSAARSRRSRHSSGCAASARMPASAGRTMSPKPTSQTPRLPFDDAEPQAPVGGGDLPDAADRAAAVDPTRNVVLEASAGTGKTRVLVDRYVNLLRAGVDPQNVLAITFTRKAAAEMRERIITTLRRAAETGEIAPTRWREIHDRLGDIAISTIDAFCLSLLREFPLEADLDPGFGMADETEVLRFVDEALDATLRAGRGVARDDPAVELVFAQLGDARLREGLAVLLERRLVARDVLRRFLVQGPSDLSPSDVCRRAVDRLGETLDRSRAACLAS